MSKTMSASIWGGVAVAVALLFLPMFTSAAEIPSTYDAIFDGQTEAWGNPNERIDLSALVSVDEGEVLHAVSTDVIGDGLPRECEDVDNVQGEQENEVDFDHKLPPNTGDYGFLIRGYIADNMNEADAHEGSTACVGDFDTLYSESDVVHVIPNGSSSNDDDNDDDNTGSSSALAALQAQIDKLVAQFALFLSGGTGSAGGKCAQFNTASNGGTSSLQNFLRDHQFMTQAEINTGPGIYGPKTTRAVTAFKAANSCN